MKKTLCTALLFVLTAITPAWADMAGADEATLRTAVERAVWPSDIVRAADQYLHSFPEGEAAGDVQSLRQRAEDSRRLLSRTDVRLYRSAFTPRNATESLNDMRLAALGDRAAAMRLARASRELDEAQGTQRFVGWLQLASMLGDDQASYELALHFRRNDQPLLAARYEAVALALGYQPARGLDNVRK